MVSNMFEVLKIANKELVLSNYFAWLLNPNEWHGQYQYFLNAFLSAAGIKTAEEKDVVFVDREFCLPDDVEKYYIDILIRFSSRENPSRVICIENKIDSQEGNNQTKRYYNGIKKLFANCNDKQYIYLTRYNSSVELTSTEFIHVKYGQLMYMFSNSNNGVSVDNVPLTADFYAEYIMPDNDRFFTNTQVDLSDKKNFNILLDGLVCWFDKETSDVFCAKGKSAQSDELFCRIYKPKWIFSTPLYPDVEFCVHLEVVRKAVYLHFETKPYIPYSKLRTEFDNDFLRFYDDLRSKLRDAMATKQPESILYITKKHKSNANLQIAKYEIKSNDYYQFYQSLKALIEDISPIMQNFLTGILN